MTSTAPLADDVLAEGIDSILGRLTLEQKVALVRGADFWSTTAIPAIGLERMLLSDGPAGVRGPRWDERDPSLSLPSGTAMAASWDVGLARRYGEACAAEARRKGVSVLLGPTINLHRSPLGGRHFECMSEDPWLTAEMGAAYVTGVQSRGVAATPKHYVANDSETERFTVDVRPTERALRELYLLPFERAVEAGAWAIMSSYNSVDGVTMSENGLLVDPLATEWGFDGAVISDWTAVRSLASASAGQDLAMPGPAPAWAGLADAVRRGEVSEADLDRKVARLLRLAARVGAIAGLRDGLHDEPAEALDGVAFARETAVAGTVLATNEHELPWRRGEIGSIAVIGQNAAQARFQGGGSATVVPERVTTPLEGIAAAFPDARIDYRIGSIVEQGIVGFPVEWMTNPRTGAPGLVATFFDEDGEVLQRDDRHASRLVWFGSDAPLARARRLELRTILHPSGHDVLQIGVATALRTTIAVDGDTVFDAQPGNGDPQLGASFSFPPSETVPVEFPRPREVVVEFDLASAKAPMQDALGLAFGSAPRDDDPQVLIAEAVDAARAADVAVVVGTNFTVESEGRDRDSLDLPGSQDELVAAVAAANPRTVVVVNAGAPVGMPWRDDVRAILLGWFGGQEFGSALGDILSGDAEPGGRLTTTWPAALGDAPVTQVVPVDGVLDYPEGIHLGYRAWLRAGTRPAFPFGHGLGYTEWSLDGLRTRPRPGGGFTAHVTLTNRGERAGSQVVQLYAERSASTVERPARWLVGFAKVRAAPGGTVAVGFDIDARRLAHWDAGWQLEPGVYRIRAGFSVEDLRLDGAAHVSEGRP